MRGRTALGILVGVLLPLPWVLMLVVPQLGQQAARPGASLSPVLSLEERRQRVTYHRPCETSADCEPPLACLDHWRLKASRCTDSECVTDAQCSTGQSCQVLATGGEGPAVRVCVTQGERGEGERCVALPRDREDACAPGLRCAEGWCGRPCQGHSTGSCPEGFVCAEGLPEPACLPACEAGGCPEGRQCVRFNPVRSHSVTACAVVHGPNCRQTACAEGQACFFQHSPRRPGEVWMACVQPCGPGQPTCPAGLLCHEDYCRQPCDAAAPGGCDPAHRCGQLIADGPSVCLPDLE